MNITDLAFKFDLNIHHDGDLDGGWYYLKLKYLTCMQNENTETETTLTMRQHDIDELYQGVLKLAKKLKPYKAYTYEIY
jgi:hypothetical protein